MYLENYIVDVIEGRKKGAMTKGILYGMSHLFKAGVKMRNLFFDRKWLKENKVPAPVLSIGNIIAGGTGKTPLIQMLANEFSAKGKISILSRGYRSGDEAYLLSKKHVNILLDIGCGAGILLNCSNSFRGL